MARKKLPFRIGTTSYIYPEDILPNVRKLKGKIDDIELILFEDDNGGNIPPQKGLKELRRISREWDLTYTVHLPLDVDLSGVDSAENVKGLVERLEVLDPYAYILHLNLPKKPEVNLRRWKGVVGESLKRIIDRRKAVARRMAVENLGYSFSKVDSLILNNDLSVCVDIGHLITMGVDPIAHCKKYFKMMRVIHLHGVNGKKDHISLKYLDGDLIRRLVDFLKVNAWHGVLTLEVFSQTDFEESLAILWESSGR